MAKDDEFIEIPDDDEEEFVAVVFARSMEEAETYMELLEDHDIPGRLGPHEDIEGDQGVPLAHQGMTHGVPIMVPESMLDEASEIIADRDNTEDFEEELEDEEDDDEFDFEEEELFEEVEEEEDDLFDIDEDDEFEGFDEEEEF